jgi:hypothetical protein
MAEVPHEQELLERWGGQGFAVVGVNADKDQAAAKQACAQKGLSWPSFWDHGWDGPVVRRWNVHSWPTMYLIDAGGVIRARGDDLRTVLVYKNADGTENRVRCLDQAVERLMSEATRGKKR